MNKKENTNDCEYEKSYLHCFNALTTLKEDMEQIIEKVIVAQQKAEDILLDNTKEDES